MPAVTPDDVADGIRAGWAAGTVNGLIPATSLYKGRAAERTAFPYARLVIEEGDRRLYSGGAYHQPFNVTVEAYSAAVSPNAGSVRAAVDSLLSGTSLDPTAGLVVPNATKVLHTRGLSGGGSEPTGERLDGADVVKVTARYEVLIQGNRG